MRVGDADLLDEVLLETADYSPDLKALVLRMVHQQGGRVEPVAQQTDRPLSTLYHWTRAWNEAHHTEKKGLISRRGVGGGGPRQVHESVWDVWRQGL